MPDNLIPGSPFVVAMIERICESLRKEYVASGNLAMVAEYDKWQKAEDNPIFLAVAQERIKECIPLNVWQGWSREKRMQVIQQFLSPFQADVEILEKMMSEYQSSDC